MIHRPLTLASASPRRRALLAAMGVPFVVRAADIDETVRPGERPIGYALRVARGKAAAVASLLAAEGGDGLVVGADSIVVLDEAILGKPATPEAARDCLRLLRGRRHVVITAVAVVDVATGSAVGALAATGVWMREYADAEIEAYVASGDPMDKAGAYAIQHPAFQPVARLEGSETNVMGLPVALTEHLVRRMS